MAFNDPESDDRTDVTRTALDSADSERPVDPDNDDSLPDHLDVGPEVPVPDVIDQLRTVVLDDDLER